MLIAAIRTADKVPFNKHFKRATLIIIGTPNELHRNKNDLYADLITDINLSLKIITRSSLAFCF